MPRRRWWVVRGGGGSGLGGGNGGERTGSGGGRSGLPWQFIDVSDLGLHVYTGAMAGVLGEQSRNLNCNVSVHSPAFTKNGLKLMCRVPILLSFTLLPTVQFFIS